MMIQKVLELWEHGFKKDNNFKTELDEEIEKLINVEFKEIMLNLRGNDNLHGKRLKQKVATKVARYLMDYSETFDFTLITGDVREVKVHCFILRNIEQFKGIFDFDLVGKGNIAYSYDNMQWLLRFLYYNEINMLYGKLNCMSLMVMIDQMCIRVKRNILHILKKWFLDNIWLALSGALHGAKTFAVFLEWCCGVYYLVEMNNIQLEKFKSWFKKNEDLLDKDLLSGSVLIKILDDLIFVKMFKLKNVPFNHFLEIANKDNIDVLFRLLVDDEKKMDYTVFGILLRQYYKCLSGDVLRKIPEGVFEKMEVFRDFKDIHKLWLIEKYKRFDIYNRINWIPTAVTHILFIIRELYDKVFDKLFWFEGLPLVNEVRNCRCNDKNPIVVNNFVKVLQYVPLVFECYERIGTVLISDNSIYVKSLANGSHRNITKGSIVIISNGHSVGKSYKISAIFTGNNCVVDDIILVKGHCGIVLENFTINSSINHSDIYIKYYEAGKLLEDYVEKVGCLTQEL